MPGSPVPQPAVPIGGMQRGYPIQSDRDSGLYFKFEVTPVTADGIKGVPVVSQNSIYIRKESGGFLPAERRRWRREVSPAAGRAARGDGGLRNGDSRYRGRTQPAGVCPGEFADVPAAHWAKNMISGWFCAGR